MEKDVENNSILSALEGECRDWRKFQLEIIVFFYSHLCGLPQKLIKIVKKKIDWWNLSLEHIILLRPINLVSSLWGTEMTQVSTSKRGLLYW